MANSTPWESLWNGISTYRGYVTTKEEIEAVKTAFEVHTSLTYILGKKEAIFGTGAVSCCTCEMESKTIDHYSALSLPLKAVNNLNDALKNFFATEMIDSYQCRRCKKTSNALKSSKISELPKNLIIQLNRFTPNGKLNKLVTAPSVLKIREHVVSTKNIDDKLRLYGFVRHFGRESNCGHYVAYVEKCMKWFRIDDMKVTAVRDITSDLNQAYLLFYKTLPRPYID